MEDFKELNEIVKEIKSIGTRHCTNCIHLVILEDFGKKVEAKCNLRNSPIVIFEKDKTYNDTEKCYQNIK